MNQQQPLGSAWSSDDGTERRSHSPGPRRVPGCAAFLQVSLWGCLTATAQDALQGGPTRPKSGRAPGTWARRPGQQHGPPASPGGRTLTGPRPSPVKRGFARGTLSPFQPQNSQRNFRGPHRVDFLPVCFCWLFFVFSEDEGKFWTPVGLTVHRKLALDTATCWTFSLCPSPPGGGGKWRWRQPWQRQEGAPVSLVQVRVYASAGLCAQYGAVCVALHGRLTELATCSCKKRFILLSGTAGAGVWSTRWLACYRCVWLEEASGPAS